MNQLELRVLTLEGQSNTQSGQIAQLIQQVATLSASVNNQSLQITALTDRVNRLEGRVSCLERILHCCRPHPCRPGKHCKPYKHCKHGHKHKGCRA